MTDQNDAECLRVLDGRLAGVSESDVRRAMAQANTPTPPGIVARAESPSLALAAFIAQELEHWGFQMQRFEGSRLRIEAHGGVVLEVEVRDA